MNRRTFLRVVIAPLMLFRKSELNYWIAYDASIKNGVWLPISMNASGYFKI